MRDIVDVMKELSVQVPWAAVRTALERVASGVHEATGLLPSGVSSSYDFSARGPLLGHGALHWGESVTVKGDLMGGISVGPDGESIFFDTEEAIVEIVDRLSWGSSGET